jgi:hypothetical protein
MPEPIDPPPMTEREEVEWRAEFARMGEEALRHMVNFNPGNLNPRSKRALAQTWLREQKERAESRERWTFRIAVAILVLTIIGIVLDTIGLFR